MVSEFTVASLAKVLSPIVTLIAKDLVGAFKEGVVKIEASRSTEIIAGLVLNINTVKTIWSKDRGLLLDEFYYSPKVLYKYSGRAINISELLDQNSVVEGIVGQGKSMLMRQLCNSVIDTGRIPVFLELRMLSKERNLIDLILDYLDACSIKGGVAVFQHLAQTGKIALILDGFDEVSSDMIKATVYQIEQFQKKYPDLVLVVSTRPNNAISNLSGFEVFSIAPLTDADYEPFLNKLVKDVLFKSSLNIAIGNAPASIKGVITTPLMLTLLCLVYENESEIPSSLPDFFDRLFNAVFTRHDKFKVGFQRELSSGLPESKIRKLFDSFCFMTLQLGHGRSLKSSEFEAVFAGACQMTPLVVCELDGFKKDIVQVACLMLEDGYDEIVFLHKSILEYHAAVFIKASSEDVSERFYGNATKALHIWSEILVFLKYIDTYRYSKYFIIGYHLTELEALTKLLAERTIESLVEYVEVRFPETYIVMNNYSVRSYNSMSCGVELPFYQNFFAVLVSVLNKAVGEADAKQIQIAIRQTPVFIKGEVLMSFKAAAENLDLSAIWVSLRGVEQNLMSLVDEAKQVVESERLKLQMLG